MAESSAFATMVKACPLEIQVEVQTLLRRAGIANDDDIMLNLMTVLGLYATYYQKIPERVTEAGGQIESQNRLALDSLDKRVRLLQGLAQVIQQATDRLGAAGQEIVDKFPTEKIANEVVRRVDTTIQGIPLKELVDAVGGVNSKITAFTEQSRQHGNKIESEMSRLESLAQRISNLDIPHVSFGWIAGCFLAGVMGTALVMYFLVVKPLQDDQYPMKQIADDLRNESFIGTFAVAGISSEQVDGPNQPIIIVRKENLKRYAEDTDGNLTVWLKRSSPPSP